MRPRERPFNRVSDPAPAETQTAVASVARWVARSEGVGRHARVSGTSSAWRPARSGPAAFDAAIREACRRTMSSKRFRTRRAFPNALSRRLWATVWVRPRTPARAYEPPHRVRHDDGDHDLAHHLPGDLGYVHELAILNGLAAGVVRPAHPGQSCCTHPAGPGRSGT